MLDIAVGLGECVVELADNLARLDRELLLALEAAVLLAGEEREAVVLVRQILKSDRLVIGLRVFLVQVVDANLVEVAGDDPLGHDAAGRDVVRVPLGLLERCDEALVAVAILAAMLRLVEADASALVLYQDGSILVEDVDSAALHLALEVELLGGVRDTQDLGAQLDPEAVRLTLLVALGGLPALHELLGGCFLLVRCHASPALALKASR